MNRLKTCALLPRRRDERALLVLLCIASPRRVCKPIRVPWQARTAGSQKCPLQMTRLCTLARLGATATKDDQ
jgi:hypothetical protein